MKDLRVVMVEVTSPIEVEAEAVVQAQLAEVVRFPPGPVVVMVAPEAMALLHQSRLLL